MNKQSSSSLANGSSARVRGHTVLFKVNCSSSRSINQSLGESSNSSHIDFGLKAFSYANASETSEFLQLSNSTPLSCFFSWPHSSGSCDYLKLCHESMKSSNHMCVPLCRQLLDLIMLFYEAWFIFLRLHIWSGNNSALGLDWLKTLILLGDLDFPFALTYFLMCKLKCFLFCL